jgi:hypothetical protein
VTCQQRSYWFLDKIEPRHKRHLLSLQGLTTQYHRLRNARFAKQTHIPSVPPREIRNTITFFMG